MKWVRFGKEKQHHRSIGRRLRRLMTLNTRIEAQRSGFDSEKEEGANIVQFSPRGGNGTVLAPSDVLARLPGLEPGTSGLGGSRSILLSYRRIRFMCAETAR